MTETITLRTAFAAYPHVQALKDGSIASDESVSISRTCL